MGTLSKAAIKYLDAQAEALTSKMLTRPSPRMPGVDIVYPLVVDKMNDVTQAIRPLMEVLDDLTLLGPVTYWSARDCLHCMDLIYSTCPVHPDFGEDQKPPPVTSLRQLVALEEERSTMYEQLRALAQGS